MSPRPSSSNPLPSFLCQPPPYKSTQTPCWLRGRKRGAGFPHWCTTHSHECQAAPLLSLHLHGFQERLRLYSSTIPPFPFRSIKVQYHYAWDNPRPLAPPFSFKKSPTSPCKCCCFTTRSKTEGGGSLRGPGCLFPGATAK